MSRKHKLYKIPAKQPAIIQQVTKSGFFVDITFEFLQQNCQNEEDGKKEMDQLLGLCLGNLHIRNVGQIGDWCPNLLVCSLPNNHLTNISAFYNCVNLIKLDIHGNQLSSIPDENFWSRMKHLEFLFLHDNPIASVDTVSHLANCPKLTALTMYDTPLSLMNKYRHHVVNTLIILKALDHYIVADQEIIEDLKATERFSAFRQELRIKLCSSSNQKISTSVALKQVTVTRCNINYIMAHHSPVIIIQKWIRSYLTRQGLNKVPKTGLMVTTSSETKSMKDFQLHKLPKTSIAAIIPKVSKFLTEQAASTSQDSHIAFAPPQTPQSQEYQVQSTNPKCSTSHLQPTPFQSLSDMLKQQYGAGDGMHLQKTSSRLNSEEESKTLQEKHSNSSRTKKGNNSRNNSHLKTEECFQLTFTGDAIPFSNFCLQGLKKSILSTDAFSELILNHQDTGEAVRDVHSKIHMSPKSEDDVRKFRASKNSNLNQHFYKRILKQMNMSCLFAVQQAYQDQQLIHCRNRTREQTQQRNTERQLAQEKRQMLQEEKWYETLHEKELLKQQIHEGIKQNAKKKTEYLAKKKENRDKSRMAFSRTEEDIEFTQEFAKKQFSISRVLSKHDKQQLEKEVTQQKMKSVKELQDQLHWSQDKIKNFQMQNILTQQMKNNKQNAKIRQNFTKLSMEKLKELQQRVTHLKEGGNKESVPYNLPLITVSELVNVKKNEHQCEIVKQ